MEGGGREEQRETGRGRENSDQYSPVSLPQMLPQMLGRISLSRSFASVASFLISIWTH